VSGQGLGEALLDVPEHVTPRVVAMPAGPRDGTRHGAERRTTALQMTKGLDQDF
jgi:hypothetical protein